jgi:hypothetical protein
LETPSLARQAFAAGVALILFSSSALATIDVKGNSATFAWEPSSGPVEWYLVCLNRNGAGFSNTIDEVVPEPRVTVRGGFGETVRVRVVAWRWDSHAQVPVISEASPVSEEVRFVDPADDGADSASTRPPATRDPDSTGTLPPAGAAPYDFDGDGRTDLLWLSSRTGALVVWLTRDDSAPAIAYLGTLASGWSVVGSGDFDRDGQADLLLRGDATAEYEAWFVSGASVRYTVPFAAPAGFSGVDAVGDFDGDGYADLLWRGTDESLVWFMRGVFVDQEVVVQPAPGVPVCAQDLDGDGTSDMLWLDRSETVAWLGIGSSSMTSQRAGPRLGGENWLGCGDADGDGFGDLLWSSEKYGTGLWAMNQQVRVGRSFELPQFEVGWAPEASGDFDGDGLANEIVLRESASGLVEVWELRWNSDRTSFDVVSTEGTGMGSANWQVVAP